MLDFNSRGKAYLSIKRKYSSILISICLVLSSCTHSSSSLDTQTAPAVSQNVISENTLTVIRSDYTTGEIQKLCQASIDRTRQNLDGIAAIPETQRTIDNTLLSLEKSTTDLSDETTPLIFMGYVSTDPAIGAEGSECETAVGQFNVEIFTRRDIYETLLKVMPRNSNEARLLQKTIESFEQNGLKLSDEILAQVRILKGKLAALETQFSTNLNSDHTTVLFAPEELEGLPNDYLVGLKKDSSGKLVVNTKESDYPLVMQNAVKADTRKKMMAGYLSRGGAVNTKLLSDAVMLRAQIGHLMGFKTWADYRTNGRMAQDGDTVLTFLNGLKDKLAKRNQDDLNKVLKFKKESDPAAATLEQWDIAYYSYQLQKRDYSLDNEKIREYFPADVVIAGLFQVYSKMLGVRYVEITNAKTWSTDVKMYAIHNSADDRLIGYFYTDFFPRAGKYDHAAAFPLISGRSLANGKYSLPVSSIVANLNPPMNGKPSLLAHDDVETIFHEFGHIMHQTLTRAPYASLAGSSVAQDYVEAPSQMLENWVWSAEILNSLSGHYLDHSQKLPTDLLQKMIAAREFNQGYSYTKQLLYALFDMTLHTQDGPVDVNKTYTDLYRQVMGIEPLANQQFPASFGHLMGGYDAGYYGYLWSEVYAQDMFTQFPEQNLLSPEVGARYRTNILEQGNMKQALDLLRNFLGREPNSDAFFKKLHI
ncbi:MAG: M3 family metallopeptidase [Pseudobdellovibrio sp.]